jgi:hypothetical protein
VRRAHLIGEIAVRSCRFTALSILSAVIVAGCAAHGSAVPTSPIVEQHTAAKVHQGTIGWTSFTYSGPQVYWMTLGSDGAMWAATATASVDRFDTTTFAQTTFTLNGPADSIIASNSNDGDLYIPIVAGGIVKIAQLTTSGTEVDFSTGSDDTIEAITACSDHNIWTVAHGTNEYYYGHLIVSTGKYSHFSRDYFLLNGILCGPDGNIWGTGQNGQNDQPFLQHIFVGGGSASYPTGGLAWPTYNNYGLVWTAYPNETFASVNDEGITKTYTIKPPLPQAIVASTPGYLWWVARSRLHAFNVVTHRTGTNLPYPVQRFGISLYVGPNNTLWSNVEPNIYIYSFK